MRKALRFYLLSFGLFLFFVINLQNISALNQGDFLKNVARASTNQYTNYATSIEDSYAKALGTLGLHLHPGTSYKKESVSSKSSLNHCKSLVYQTLASLPKEHREHLKNLTLYFADGRRGLGGGSTVILRCSNVSDKELSSVLVHEMGHVVDTGLYTGNSWYGKSEFMDGNIPIYNDDLSLRFYKITWENDKKLKKGAKESDFVSEYAMTDPFEDFAETYNFYILHGKQFREMTEFDRSLMRKYLFMKYYIFKGQEFDNDPYTKIEPFTRTYDATLLNYNEKSFIKTKTLASL
ncbi:putative zinc-binding metallopeptidase [bacterium]|nr:putative zinc-binding metallopeptidase [bacterium]